MNISCADIEKLIVLIRLYETNEVEECHIREVNMARFHLASCAQCFFIAQKLFAEEYEFCELLWDLPRLFAEKSVDSVHTHLQDCKICEYWLGLIKNNWKNTKTKRINVDAKVSTTIEENTAQDNETANEITHEFEKRVELEELRKAWEQITGGLENKEPEMTYKGNYLSLNKETFESLPKLTISGDETNSYDFSRSEDLEESYQSASSFEIVSKIDQGGMGVVFEGRQNSLRRNIAIKQVIEPDIQKKEKFVAEALVTAYLDHPNIVPVHELGINDQGELMLIMKKIGGISWKRLLHPKTIEEQGQSQKYQQEDHLKILLSVCNAIAFAHNKGIIHNDLKPSNVMVGEFGEVLVMDWGIAVDMYERQPKETHALHRSLVKKPMGTPCYMAPELAQGQGNAIGPWTDIYLLGAVLYEILMGKPPHRQKTMWDSISLASEGKIPTFSSSTPLELREICTTAMSRIPQKRYNSAIEFKEAIERFLQHRESILISDKAQQILNHCQKTVEPLPADKFKGIKRNQLYGQFSQVIAYFQQSLELWEGNAVAAEKIIEARKVYSQVALQNGDLGLARSQAIELGNTGQAKSLHNKIDGIQKAKERNQKLNTRLRLGLILAVILIVLAATIGLFAYKKADAIWKRASQELTHSTTQSALRYLEPAIPYIQFTREFAKRKEIKIGFDNTIINYFMAAIKSHPNFTWVSFGSDTGDYLAVYRNSKNEIAMTWRQQLSIGKTQIKEFILDKNDKWQNTKEQIGSYDPRQRLWYKAAQKHPQGVWVDPFIFATEKKPGFMYTARSENLKTAWTVEYEISHLSEFLADLKVGKKGRVYIITDQGRVVGHPQGLVASEDGQKILHASAHPDKMLSETWKKLQKQKSKQGYLTFGSYTAMYESFPSESGIDWKVLVVTPTEEIFGDVRTEIWDILKQVILLILISIALFAIYRLWKR